MFTDLELYQYIVENEEADAINQPDVWLYLKSGRSIEITLEKYGIENPADWFITVWYMCSEEEFDAYPSPYYLSNGVISQMLAASMGKDSIASQENPHFYVEDLTRKNIAQSIRLFLDSFGEEIDW